jgi:hypothetical protein
MVGVTGKLGFTSYKGQKFLPLVCYPDRFRNLPILLSSRFQGFLPDIKWFVHEADNSSPSNAKFKNAWSYASTLLYIYLR